jgi:VIT1/CCC1 family predicted Fe2+/Mn2+ transporter
MKVSEIFNRMVSDLSKFSFGATSAVTTSLALIVGLDQASNPKMSIISALLVIAVADNISDSLGIHIYHESQNTARGSSNVYAISNFLTRLIITLIFISLVVFLPIQYAVLSSVAIGLLLLLILSYLIAVNQQKNTTREVFYHMGVAIAVLVASHFLGRAITNSFSV